MTLRTFTALAFGLLLITAAHAQNLTDEEYQAKIQQLQQSIKLLQKELSKVKGSRDQLQTDLQNSEVDISKLVKKIDTLQGELASQKKQLVQLNRKQDELQASRKQQQQHIAQDINAAYRLGGQSQLKLLLNQEKPDSVARMNRYYQYFLEARANRIEAYLDTIAELDTLKPQIENRTSQLQRSRDQLQLQHQQLLASQQQRNATLAKLNSSIARKDDELKKKAADQEHLEKLLEEVTAAIANLKLPDDGAPFAAVKGKMRYPTQGRLVKKFGSNKVDGKLKWEGVLISAKQGSAVQAIHHGRVVFADYLRGQGLLLIVDHGDGFMSLYGHNQALLKEPGDWVSSGETIARVGNTGGLGQAALYFEIRHKGKPTNPARWCRA